MSQTDLHLHSSVSGDGEVSPRGVAELCCQYDVTLAALTDHNDITGVAEFIWRCAQLGIQAISGVELDCMYESTLLHILGYGIDISHPTLLRALRETQERQKQTGLRMMDAVASLGIRFDQSQVLETAGDGAVCAEMIAQSALRTPENHTHPLIRPLLPGGALSSRPLIGFYWSVCAPGKPAYVPVQYMAAKQAISLLHEAGGRAILAHPGASITEPTILDEVLQLPFDGIEAFSSYHSAEQAALYTEKAKEQCLLVTGGSDFHGNTKPDIQIGAVDWQGHEQEAWSALLNALSGEA